MDFLFFLGLLPSSTCEEWRCKTVVSSSYHAEILILFLLICKQFWLPYYFQALQPFSIPFFSTHDLSTPYLGRRRLLSFSCRVVIPVLPSCLIRELLDLPYAGGKALQEFDDFCDKEEFSRSRAMSQLVVFPPLFAVVHFVSSPLPFPGFGEVCLEWRPADCEISFFFSTLVFLPADSLPRLRSTC